MVRSGAGVGLRLRLLDLEGIEERSMDDVTGLKRNRVQVVIMLVTFPLLSVGAAWILFYLAGNVQLDTTNNGEFVDAVKAADLALEGPDGRVLHDAGTWWIWMVTEDCEAACEETLVGLRQLHLLLNKDAERVQRGLVAMSSSPYQRVRDRFPALRFLRSGASGVLAPGVYIVDPIGNVVLRYALDTEPRPVLDDLKRLLKVSQIG